MKILKTVILAHFRHDETAHLTKEKVINKQTITAVISKDLMHSREIIMNIVNVDNKKERRY